MMIELEIYIPIEAQPQGSKKAFIIKGKVVLVESSNDLKKNRKLVSAHITSEAYKDKWVRVSKPAAVFVQAVFGMTKPPSVKREHHTVAPDLDKLGRFLLDALTDAGNVFEDDSQVTELNLAKLYTNAPGIYLIVKTNDEQ
jgi:Holliday junction resolvase RusA-like endonuclease